MRTTFQGNNLKKSRDRDMPGYLICVIIQVGASLTGPETQGHTERLRKGDLHLEMPTLRLSTFVFFPFLEISTGFWKEN